MNEWDTFNSDLADDRSFEVASFRASLRKNVRRTSTARFVRLNRSEIRWRDKPARSSSESRASSSSVHGLPLRIIESAPVTSHGNQFAFESELVIGPN